MFVEFTGVPNSGKSTISHILSKKLRAMGYSVDEIPYVLSHETGIIKRSLYRLFLSLNFIIKHPKKTNEILKEVQGSMVMRFNLLYILGLYSRGAKKDFCILDQGISQGILSFFQYSGCDQPRLKKILMVLKDVVPEINQVVFMADEKVILSRIEKRKDSTYFKDAEKKEELITLAVNNNNCMAHAWCNVFNANEIIEVKDVDKKPAFIADLILTNIKNKEKVKV